MILTDKLTPNFTLLEMLKSATADKHGIAEQYKPTPEVVSALKTLCEKTLQPLRDYIAAKYSGAIIKVNSGYRCPSVNKLQPKASKTSQHMKGEAADIIVVLNGQVRNDILVKCICEMGQAKKLLFDQVIWEYGPNASNPAWVHISYSVHQLRGAQLRPQGKGYVEYKLF